MDSPTRIRPRFERLQPRPHLRSDGSHVKPGARLTLRATLHPNPEGTRIAMGRLGAAHPGWDVGSRVVADRKASRHLTSACARSTRPIRVDVLIPMAAHTRMSRSRVGDFRSFSN